MITGFEIYCITRLGTLNIVFGATWIVAGVITTIAGIVYLVSLIEGDEDVTKASKMILWKTGPIMLIVAMLFVLTPTEKEVCAMIVIPAVVNNEGVQQLPDKVMELANEWIEELRPKQPEKKDSSP